MTSRSIRLIASRFTVVVSLTAASLCTTSLASADAISPDEGACAGKAAGDTCSLPDGASTKAGVCDDDTCAHVQYLPDGGRGSANYACVICNTSGTSTPDASAPDAATLSTDAAPTATNPPATAASSSSCAAASVVGVKTAGPLALAALVPFALLLGARRRRRS